MRAYRGAVEFASFLLRPKHQHYRKFASETGGVRKLKLTLASPYQTILKESAVEQVNLSTTDGDLGVLGGHVPSILQLRPGTIEIFSNAPASSANTLKQTFFVSGGFAMVNPDSSMEITAMEAVPLGQLDSKAIGEGWNEAQRRMQGIGSASTDLERAEIHIHHEVYQALYRAISK